ncbi:MAG: tRNA dihydrouridine synthase DusB [Paludibacter sp.]|nr:MAG: tRNA dihydrouridine synthase DusB [Paludibacter sp.]
MIATKIANLQFPQYPLFLAPMEGVTDGSFRLLCKQFGADMVYTEFISADALIRKVNRTKQKLTIKEEERPVAIQLYGRDVDSMVEAVKIAEEAEPDIIDLNFGCPVKKVAGKGAGAGLLNNIPLLLDITKNVVKAVNVPVTVKTRLGWDSNSKIIVELAEQLQDCGIQALTVHGRTRSQMYKGDADWEMIGKVKNNPRVKIPIIGNGDVVSGEQAKEYFDKYGVDAIMIGRGSIGKPWIFQEIQEYLNYGEIKTVLTFKEQVEVLKQQVLSSIDMLDERKGILHSRRHLAASPTFKGIKDFRETKIKMLRATKKDELFTIIDNIYKVMS